MLETSPLLLYLHLQTLLWMQNQPSATSNEKGKDKTWKAQCPPRSFIEEEIQHLNKKTEEKVAEVRENIRDASKEEFWVYSLQKTLQE